MDSPRRISRQLDLPYIDEIIELSQNINVYSVSLLVDYQNIFKEKDKRAVNQYINKIEEYIELLKGFKELLTRGKCHSSIHKKFKIIAQEIFEIELLLKQYSVDVWKTELTDISQFKNGDNYCFVAYSLLMDPNLKYKYDEQLKQEQYEKRMNMLQDPKRRFLSTSLLTNELTRLFYGSHIAAIIQVDESNYIAANYRDAGTGDSMFTSTCVVSGIYDDIYTIRRDTSGNIFTREPATIVSTPKIIKYKQLYDESAVSVSEIILDREESKVEGILCYVYGNEFLSYSRKFAQKLGEKYNLPVVYVDKMLYANKDIREYELEEISEVTDGIKQYLDKDIKEKIYNLSRRDFDTDQETYLKIFELANKENIQDSEEAKRVVKNIARQVIKQKEQDLCLGEEL